MATPDRVMPSQLDWDGAGVPVGDDVILSCPVENLVTCSVGL